MFSRTQAHVLQTFLCSSFFDLESEFSLNQVARMAILACPHWVIQRLTCFHKTGPFDLGYFSVSMMGCGANSLN